MKSKGYQLVRPSISLTRMTTSFPNFLTKINGLEWVIDKPVMSSIATFSPVLTKTLPRNRLIQSHHGHWSRPISNASIPCFTWVEAITEVHIHMVLRHRLTYPLTTRNHYGAKGWLIPTIQVWLLWDYALSFMPFTELPAFDVLILCGIQAKLCQGHFLRSLKCLFSFACRQYM